RAVGVVPAAPAGVQDVELGQEPAHLDALDLVRPLHAGTAELDDAITDDELDPGERLLAGGQAGEVVGPGVAVEVVLELLVDERLEVQGGESRLGGGRGGVQEGDQGQGGGEGGEVAGHGVNPPTGALRAGLDPRQ